jgi:hypothetical protein
MPRLPALAVPMPRIGKSSNCSSVMSWATSPLSVLSSVASAWTVTDSVVAPTSSMRPSGTVWPASTEIPERVSFLKPDAVTVTL